MVHLKQKAHGNSAAVIKKLSNNSEQSKLKMKIIDRNVYAGVSRYKITIPIQAFYPSSTLIK
jgi:hypothetical protein